MNTSQALAPIFVLIKTWVFGIIFIAVAYIGAIVFLKMKGMRGRQLTLWKTGLHILTGVIMFVWSVQTLVHG